VSGIALAGRNPPAVCDLSETEIELPEAVVLIWVRTKAVLRIGTLAAALASACSRAPTSPSSSSLSVGQWNGTTAQGTSVAFTVASDETLTTLPWGTASTAVRELRRSRI
jgi:hypothetical protein